jgi:hypothetical protein
MLANDLVERPNEICAILNDEYAVLGYTACEFERVACKYTYLTKDLYTTKHDEQKAIAFQMCRSKRIETFLHRNYFTSIPSNLYHIHMHAIRTIQ